MSAQEEIHRLTVADIARMYADARVQKVYGGANEIMKEIIARAL